MHLQLRIFAVVLAKVHGMSDSAIVQMLKFKFLNPRISQKRKIVERNGWKFGHRGLFRLNWLTWHWGHLVHLSEFLQHLTQKSLSAESKVDYYLGFSKEACNGHLILSQARGDQKSKSFNVFLFFRSTCNFETSILIKWQRPDLWPFLWNVCSNVKQMKLWA